MAMIKLNLSKEAAAAKAKAAAVPSMAPSGGNPQEGTPVDKNVFVAPTAKCAAKAPAAKAPAAKAAVKAHAAKCAASKAPAAKAAAKAPAAKNMSRKCVHSRAYKAAAKTAKDEGLDAAQVSKAACAAGKVANRQWDEQFGQGSQNCPSESNSD